MLPWRICRSIERSESQDFGHETKKKERQKQTAIDRSTTKKESGEFRDKGEANQAFSSHTSALQGIVRASMWIAEIQQNV